MEWGTENSAYKQFNLSGLYHAFPNVPEEIISELYRQEFEALKIDATVPDFIPIFAERNVRQILASGIDILTESNNQSSDISLLEQ